MQNNINLSLGDAPILFSHRITESLDDNLDKQLCKSVASLLAIDYAGRLNSLPDMDQYITTCINRLKKHLGLKVILDNDFSSSMTLFVVAITPEKDLKNDENKIKETSIDSTIEYIISSFFVDINPMEQATIKSIIQELLNSKDAKEITNFITSNPKLFYSIVLQTLNAKKHQEEALQSISTNLKTIMDQSKNLDRKVGNIKDLSTKAILSTGILVASSLGLAVNPTLLPLLLVPSVIASTKFAPKLGNTIGTIISKNISSIRKEKKDLQNLKAEQMVLSKSKEKTKALDKKHPKDISLDKSDLKKLGHKNTVQIKPLSIKNQKYRER